MKMNSSNNNENNANSNGNNNNTNGKNDINNDSKNFVRPGRSAFVDFLIIFLISNCHMLETLGTCTRNTDNLKQQSYSSPPSSE
jgi:hypothetical protein